MAPPGHYSYDEPIDWHSILSRWRCQAWCRRGQCQLYDGHDGAHAHAWTEPDPVRRTRRGHPLVTHAGVERWTDTEAWTEGRDQHLGRLGWCCLYAP